MALRVLYICATVEIRSEVMVRLLSQHYALHFELIIASPATHELSVTFRS